MATGVRKGGGAKVAIKGGKGASTLRKPKGLKPDANYKAKSIHSSSNKQGILGKVAQKRETRRIMQEGAKKMGISPKPARKLLKAKTPANVMGRKFGKIQKTSTVTMADSARITKMIGRMDRRKAAKVKAPEPRATATQKGRNRVDYAGAVKLLKSQAAAIKRLKSPQQTFNGNAEYARQLDRIKAKSTPMANALREVRALKGEYRRRQASAKNPYALASQRERAARDMSDVRPKISKAVRVARAFKPAYSGETKRRYLASK